MNLLHHLGVHRSMEPSGVLPQQADRLDTSPELQVGEVAIEVELLNVDSASWRELQTSCGGDRSRMAARIEDIVRTRGKLHNPVTGSGGMLIGTVGELGPERADPALGTRIATLVSLTLTPLQIDEITSLDPGSEQVRVRGRAVLFGSGIYTEVPDDLPVEVTLRVLDVCGAPAWMAALARRGMRIVVVGAGGKSGVLACAQARRSVGQEGRVLGLCWPEESAVAAKTAGAEAVVVDATHAIDVMTAVTEAFDGAPADLVFVCTNVPGCEGGAIACCAEGGRVVFFSMATSFTAAALTAEGLGKACELTIGNGYVPGHAELALDLVRSEPALLDLFA